MYDFGDILPFIGTLMHQVFLLPTPWGISYGATCVGAGSFILLFLVIKKVF